MIKLFTTLKHKLKYAKAKRNKNFKSNIRTCRTLQCSIIQANRFDEFDDYDMAYHMSSIYTLISFDINYDSSLTPEFDSLSNRLQMYGFRFVVITINDIKYVVIEGSIADYDKLINVYYREIEKDNIFISNIVRELRFIPAQYFKNIPDDDTRESWMDYNSNQFSEGDSRFKELIREHDSYETMVIENEIGTINIPEIDRNKYPWSYYLIDRISCAYIAVCADDVNEQLVNYSDAMYTKENRYGILFCIYKLRLQMVASYSIDFNDAESYYMVYNNTEDSELQDLEINNDDYYKDIDEVIEE